MRFSFASRGDDEDRSALRLREHRFGDTSFFFCIEVAGEARDGGDDKWTVGELSYVFEGEGFMVFKNPAIMKAGL